MHAKSDPTAAGPVIRVAELVKGQPRALYIEPAPEARAAVARALGIDEVKKLRFDGQLAPLGKRDWHLTGTLGATVVQPCVVTLAPVTTRIDSPVDRRFLADWQEPTGDEVEMPQDVDADPLGAEIDIGAVMIEALALALPDFPRAAGVELDEAIFTEPGQQPMTDEAARPFAGLAGLRAKLTGDDNDEG